MLLLLLLVYGVRQCCLWSAQQPKNQRDVRQTLKTSLIHNPPLIYGDPARNTRKREKQAVEITVGLLFDKWEMHPEVTVRYYTNVFLWEAPRAPRREIARVPWGFL